MNPTTRHRLKSLCFWKRQPQLPGALHHSLRQGMFAAQLGSGSFGQELLRRQRAVHREDIRHGRMARGDGAGLVQDDGVHVVEVFQAFSGLNQDSHFRSLACAHHNGHRRGQAQSAGAGDNQHGNSVGQGKLKAHTGDEPHNGRHYGDGDDHRHKYAADLVCQPGDGRLGVAGFIYQTDNLGERSVLSHLGSPKLKSAIFVYRGGNHRIAGTLLHRDALAGDGSLVHIAVALSDNAVHRDPLAGADDHNIPGRHLLRGDSLLHPAPEHHGGFGCQIHQLAQSVSRFRLRSRLQILAHRHQGEDHGRGLKVQGMGVFMDKPHIPVAEPISQPEHGEQPVHQRRPRANGHQGIHVGRPVPQRLKTRLEKMAVDKQHGDCQKQLGQGVYQRVFHTHKEPGHRQPHHAAHGNVHQGHQQHNGRNKPALHLLLAVQGLVLPGLPLAAETALAWRGCLPLQRGGAVADFFHSLDDVLLAHLALVVGDGHLVGQQADVYILHALQFGDAPGHVGLAGGAGHAGDVVFFCFHIVLLTSAF